jgi:hypothetical protein
VTDDVPPDVRQFILDSIDSVAQLEALLLLYRSPEQEWTADEVAHRLYIDARSAREMLAALATRGLIAAEGQSEIRYRYRPRSEDLATQVARLEAVYRERLIPVTKLIHAKPTGTIQHFADAFRLRRDG